ncbi:MAG: Xaa-Pro peptidase family protein [Dehalococcoidia bacterium]|nr:Xaa-Pro peptidase family protein [Dehalococcoidia bacterium]
MSEYKDATVVGDLALLSEPWFNKAEYLDRLQRIQAELVARRLDGVLLFQPESITWLTGFFTRGYSSFQFVAVPSSGDPSICCRDVEEYHLDQTCVFEERVLWTDSDQPESIGAKMVEDKFGASSKLGIELSAWTLNAARFSALDDLLSSITFSDVSDLCANMRLIKSKAEIQLMRRAALAAEAGMTAAASMAFAGGTERELAAAVCKSLVSAGSDHPGPGVISSGPAAFHLHGSYTDRVFCVGDTIQLETLPCVRHYHARFMRPIKVEQTKPGDEALVEKLIRIQDKALSEVGPDVAATVPDSVYRREVLGSGLAEQYTNKTFYSIGLLLHPSGGEALEASPIATWSFQPGMTFHTYVLARDFGMSETIVITETGYERLTQFSRELVVGGQ